MRRSKCLETDSADAVNSTSTTTSSTLWPHSNSIRSVRPVGPAPTIRTGSAEGKLASDAGDRALHAFEVGEIRRVNRVRALYMAALADARLTIGDTDRAAAAAEEALAPATPVGRAYSGGSGAAPYSGAPVEPGADRHARTPKRIRQSRTRRFPSRRPRSRHSVVGCHSSRRPDHRNTALSAAMGNHRTDTARTVITLGYALAVGLPLTVLILAVVLPDRRDKR